MIQIKNHFTDAVICDSEKPTAGEAVKEYIAHQRANGERANLAGGYTPHFFASNEVALKDIKKRAGK